MKYLLTFLSLIVLSGCIPTIAPSATVSVLNFTTDHPGCQLLQLSQPVTSCTFGVTRDSDPVYIAKDDQGIVTITGEWGVISGTKTDASLVTSCTIGYYGPTPPHFEICIVRE
jgi:hypothetical protein